MTMHDMTKRDARCTLTRYEVVPVKGGNIRESIPGVSRFRTDEPEGGKLCVCYARDAWRMNGLRIRIRLVVLSNFHVQSIFHLSYGLFYINFKRFKSFLGLI